MFAMTGEVDAGAAGVVRAPGHPVARSGRLWVPGGVERLSPRLRRVVASCARELGRPTSWGALMHQRPIRDRTETDL